MIQMLKSPNYLYITKLINLWEPLITNIINGSQGSGGDKSVKVNGMLIPKEEIDKLWSSKDYFTSRSISDHIENLREACTLNGSKSNFDFQIDLLCRRINANEIEKGILILAIAQEIDIRFEKIFAILNDNIHRPYLTCELLIRLISEVFDTDTDYVGSLKKLIQLDIVSLIPENNQIPFALLNIRLKKHILYYLINMDMIDSLGMKSISVCFPDHSIGDIEKTCTKEISNLAVSYNRLTKQPNINYVTLELVGPDTIGKFNNVCMFASTLKKPLIVVDVKKLAKEPDNANCISNILNCARIYDGILYFKNCHYLEDGDISLQYSISQLNLPLMCFSYERQCRLWWRSSSRCNLHFEISFPGIDERKLLWKRYLNSPILSEVQYEEIASRHKFTKKQIQVIANQINLKNDFIDLLPDMIFKEVMLQCSSFHNKNIDSSASVIHPRYEWSDLILPQVKKDQLFGILNMLKYKNRVYKEWGYDKKICRNPGIKALFYGESGTGKTMAAEVLGSELNTDIIKIDLSRIISKYIGETEKNLDRIFTESANTSSILFFDEADAIFGKRSEVKDAHDRYANIETAYLLQKMEDYDGLVILATNLKQNIDKAFIRRFQFIIEFPIPEKQERHMLWENMFPDEVPLSNDIDIEYLSESFNLTGGNIKNAVLTAAFSAASDGSQISMRSLLKGICREYEKSGKMLSNIDFGKYQSLVGNFEIRKSKC